MYDRCGRPVILLLIARSLSATYLCMVRIYTDRVTDASPEYHQVGFEIGRRSSRQYVG